MVFPPPKESFSSFTEAFDGRTRTANPRPGWVSLSSLGRRQHYDPNQPRVPAGHHDGGQWMRVGSDHAPERLTERRDWTRVASNEPPDLPEKQNKPSQLPDRRRVPEKYRPRSGGGFLDSVAEYFYRRKLAAYRAEWKPRTLFGYRDGFEKGVVAITKLDGQPIIGVSSDFAPYSDADRQAVEQMRIIVIRNNFEQFKHIKYITQAPLDAFYHAEATALLRAARANNGTLAGKTLEVLVERKPCPPSCQKMLPLIGRELGNPTVIFKSLDGWTGVIRDGEWVYRSDDEENR